MWKLSITHHSVANNYMAHRFHAPLHTDPSAFYALLSSSLAVIIIVSTFSIDIMEALAQANENETILMSAMQLSVLLNEVRNEIQLMI